MYLKSFTFNDFSENTYILYDDSNECIIIDPGCNNKAEQTEIINFISEYNLKPKKLINTHCHIDHILGNNFIAQQYHLELSAHKKETAVLNVGVQTALMYHIPYDPSPQIKQYLDEGDHIAFGNSTLEVLFTPGHSPASISLLCRDSNILIAGDVLFQGSIGRTDLPGGNFETLTRVIRSKFFTLPDDIIVYPGHGSPTTIGIEKKTNPFF
ncbi:MAG: MBL fold metallo-hydrolase [Saprospiraceae bacterium]|jgi:hydroxyacylglutathione hydrolase|nr:MBL fold metallo-hydrolase [Saprospiraceae bacterium]